MKKITFDKADQDAEKLPGVSEVDLKSLKKVFSCFPAIDEIVLFGSRIKGKHSVNSDLDICLRINGKSDGQKFDMKTRIQQMLASKIDYPIHIMEVGEINNDQLLYSIKNEGKIISPSKYDNNKKYFLNIA